MVLRAVIIIAYEGEGNVAGFLCRCLNPMVPLMATRTLPTGQAFQELQTSVGGQTSNLFGSEAAAIVI